MGIGELHPDMRKREVFDLLINNLGPEEAAEIHDEAAAALGNLSKDCNTNT